MTTDEKHLEIFCLVWLDSNTNETRDTEQKLRAIINHLEKFHDVKSCQNYLEKTGQKDRLILIVSGRLGQEILPTIHKLRQIISIYVYCMDKKTHKKWASKYVKIKDVLTDLNELIIRITEDHKIQKKIHEPLSISIFSTSGQSTTKLNGQFVFSQVLGECLLRLKSNDQDQNELIQLCRHEYQNNSEELAHLREFEQQYSSTNVLKWYTRESFFYKTLNAALRTQNIHMIFLFRSYIFDIYQQLETYRSKQSLRVYRGQVISNEELNILKQSIGQLISINSFFSTSRNIANAYSFLNRSTMSDDVERVLFQIDTDSNLFNTKPFADLSQLSEYTDEFEVLFMVGSIFRLKKIFCDKNRIWIIEMDLCNDEEHDLKEILNHMKMPLGNGQTNLRILAKFLSDMGKFELAEKYLTRLLEQMLRQNDPLIKEIYEDLRRIAAQMGNYDGSIAWHHKLSKFENEQDACQVEEKLLTTKTFKIHTTWKNYGRTIAGGNQRGCQLNQLNHPEGIDIDDEQQTIYIADFGNHRIIEWKFDADCGQVIAGGNGEGSRLDQLHWPTDVIVDRKTNSLIICDQGNRRVVRWSRTNRKKGEILISDIDCQCVTMNKNGDIYVSDHVQNDVKRWKNDEKYAKTVAGGNNRGNRLDQLDFPTCIYVDDQLSIYISDTNNHRVIKWLKGARKGLVVAGGYDIGNSLKHLYYPRGLLVTSQGDIYVADWGNYRVMFWQCDSKQGCSVVGANDQGQTSNEVIGLRGLSYDRHSNLYFADAYNHRIQKFEVQ